MERRRFLTTGLAFAALAGRRSVRAAAGTRAAVVIGVDKCGTLPVLSAAAAGASQVGRFLTAEGFEVHEFVKPPVQAKPIYDAVAALIDRGTLQQLVIYFSGHGFLNNYNEYWMLSGAPDNPNEAVSLVESVDLARETSIPNVVFISDACRSTPSSLGAQRVRGQVIFPSAGRASNVRPEVDRFLAALPGEAALELPVDKATTRYEGIYTSSFLEAYAAPSSEMVREVGGVEVVPNRSLKKYLAADVQRRASRHSIQLHQLPDSIIESGDTTYIARTRRAVAPPATPRPMPTASPLRGTVSDVVGAELERAGLGRMTVATRALSGRQLEELGTATGFTAARGAVAAGQAPLHFETQTGLSVNGTPVVQAVAGRGVPVDVLPPRDGAEPALVRVHLPGQGAASVVLRFADGGGTVVAALHGYIASLTVDRGRVVNVNYTPSQNNWRWGDYASVRDRLTDLRSTVAAAARLGAFRIEGTRKEREQNASRLADRIRLLKGIDPTLGLYAAYAYAEAGLVDQVRSVMRFMRDDLNTDIFDVALLAGTLAEKPPGGASWPVPFCPMLSQGWALLRVRRVLSPPGFEDARDHLRSGLWTTFAPEGVERALSALSKGLQ